jgi:hypothetical protein
MTSAPRFRYEQLPMLVDAAAAISVDPVRLVPSMDL